MFIDFLLNHFILLVRNNMNSQYLSYQLVSVTNHFSPFFLRFVCKDNQLFQLYNNEYDH